MRKTEFYTSYIPTPKRNQGFTLVELSIVVVVIGLVLGGFLIGKSVIRRAQINSIMTDMQQFKAATAAFYTKYNSLPGDMDDATTYWGSASCIAVQTTAETCNGDGDGSVESNWAASPTSGHENFLFWKHLSNAGLIAGNYSGVSDSADPITNYYAVTSNNAPSGKLKNSLWYAVDFGTQSASSMGMFDNVYNHTFEFGAYEIDGRPINGIVTASEAYALDSKYDDGKPGTGSVLMRPTWQLCAVKATDTSTQAGTSDYATAIYNTAKNLNICVFEFIDVFKDFK